MRDIKLTAEDAKLAKKLIQDQGLADPEQNLFLG